MFAAAALLYLNPLLVGSAVATALANGDGQLMQLVSYSKSNQKESEASQD